MELKVWKSFSVILAASLCLWYVGDKIIAPLFEAQAKAKSKTVTLKQDVQITADDPCAAYWRYKEYADLNDHYRQVGGIPEAGKLIENVTTESAQMAFRTLYGRMKEGMPLECRGGDYFVIDEIATTMYKTGILAYANIYTDPVIRRAYITSLRTEIVSIRDKKDKWTKEDIASLINSLTLDASLPPWHLTDAEIGH